METLPIMVLLGVLIAVVLQTNKTLEIIAGQLQTITFHFKGRKEPEE